MRITVSVIKADVGGIGGHTLPSEGLLNAIRKTVKDAGDLLIDHYIGFCGDDSHIVMTHNKGIDYIRVHDVFETRKMLTILNRVFKNRTE